MLVGYVTADATFDGRPSLELRRGRLPAALVPRLAGVDTMPTRTCGKVDRDALPWPLPKDGSDSGQPSEAPAVAGPFGSTSSAPT